MCTCSWLHCDGGYDLLFNRDEQWSRKTALLPRLLVRNGARYLAPIDADAGGTWLGVNAFGVSVGLLNRYQDMGGPPIASAQPVEPFISRGILVKNLLDSRSPEEARSRVESLDLARFQPFTLIVIAPAQPALLMEWNSRDLSIDPQADRQMPLSSSSYDTGNALQYRRDLLARLGSGKLTPETLRTFHASQEPGRAAYGPCMERSDAHTVSFSWIRVRPAEIAFEYLPGAPCATTSTAPFVVTIKPAPAKGRTA